MYNIGTFSKKNAVYQGTINSVELKTDAVFLPVEKSNEKAPDYRIVTDRGAEIGAAWNRVAKESGNPYLSVTLDTSSLKAPIYCRLMEAGEDFNLVWSRD